MLIFDLESEPLPDEELRRIFGEPDVGVPHPGEFDPASVKIGNLKDAAKIKEKIDFAQADHEAAVAIYPQRLADARANAFAEFKAKAALSATTGRILCIGYHNPNTDQTAIDDGANDSGKPAESMILARFWRRFAACCKESRSMVGLNISEFDLPFICRRSWVLGVGVPAGVLGQGRYWHSAFVDLRKIWLCGQMAASCKSSFDELAAAFGTDGKPKGINGGDFAELWHRDRATAIAYLENDLKQPAKWARAMGVC